MSALADSAFANTWYYPSFKVAYLIEAFINNFFMINSAEYYFMCLVAICMSFPIKLPLKSCAHFYLSSY